MTGYLIYDPAGWERNRWFAGELCRHAEENGICLQPLLAKSASVSFPEKPDFAIIRTINPTLTKHIERMGVRTFNNSLTAKTGNDKWLTYLLCRKLNIPTMDTFRDFCSLGKYPCVIKSTDGHGGSEVFLAENATERECAERFLQEKKKTYIFQPLCDSPGIDRRLYLMGNRLLACVERHSKTDFRSNFSLGGSAVTVPVQAKQLEIAQRLQSVLKSDYIGVDFICHRGQWLLNEVEDVVGARMLYALTKTDPAAELIRHIASL